MRTASTTTMETETSTFERRLRALAAAVGGISALAARCRVTEARIIAWLSGSIAPTPDEQYVLQLIAQSAGVARVFGGSSIPPRSSYIRGREGDGGGDGKTGTAEPDPYSYEAYTEWLKSR